MNIALIGVFDGGPLTDGSGQVLLAVIRSFIAARLDRAPMLRRVLLPTRAGQGRMAWADAQRFDIADHVVLARPQRPFTGEEDFLGWCARRSVIPLDHARPLWRMEVIPGLPDGRIGVMIVVHHVVADGLRGVAMIGALLDPAPTSAAAAAIWRPEPPPTAVELVADNLRSMAASIRRARPSKLPQRLRALQALGAEHHRRAPPTCLTGAIGAGRRLVVLRQPLEQLRASARDHGCTINDLLLAAVTTGLRRMLQHRGQAVPGAELWTSVPVGARPGSAAGMMVVALPVGAGDPAQRLQRITAQTRRGKQQPDEGIAGIVSMSATLARLGVRWARHTASSHINLYVTNVPGPPFPLYLAGARLLDAIPLAPLVAGVRLSVTALSYHGVLAIALLADEAIVDLPMVATGMNSYFRQASSSPPPAAARSTALTSNDRDPAKAPQSARWTAHAQPQQTKTRHPCRLRTQHPAERCFRTGGDVVKTSVTSLMRGNIAVINAETDIARPAPQVFDYASDPANEPDWNIRMSSLEKLTGGPAGIGARYRMRFTQGPPALSECVRYQRPQSWELAGRSKILTSNFTGQVTPTGDGSHLLLRMQLQPRGPLRLAMPLLRRRMQRELERDIAAIKHRLEGNKQASG